MFKYLKQYKFSDMLAMMRNGKKDPLKTDADMKGKWICISGATSGVGMAAAERFARAGSNILIVVRNKDKAAVLCSRLCEDFGIDARFVIADFTDLHQVRKAAEEIIKFDIPIDVLINSTGIHSTKKIITEAGFELSFCVNHLSPFLFTKLLTPKLKAQTQGARIIQVNSEGHRFANVRPSDVNFKKRHYGGLRGYGASKTAQLLCSWEFADRLKDSGVTINAMHPGAVKTNIGSNNGVLYRWYFKHFVYPGLRDVQISGDSLFYLAAAPELSEVNGRFFSLTFPEKPAPHALDRELGKIIWKLSLELCGEKDDI